ncbi:isochorismatase family protein [Streptomyces tricolor]|nr:isochorismatase family protein [Streptomyces tricolor]
MWKVEWVDPRSTALLVIDVQQGFVNQHSRGIIPAVVRLVEGWQAAGAPWCCHGSTTSPDRRTRRSRDGRDCVLPEEASPRC